MVQQFNLLIDGVWQEASDKATFERRSLYNRDVLASYANGTREDADQAILAARRSFDNGVWRNLPVAKRTALLKRVAGRLRQAVDEIGLGVTAEIGQPVGKGMTLSAADFIVYYMQSWRSICVYCDV